MKYKLTLLSMNSIYESARAVHDDGVLYRHTLALPAKYKLVTLDPAPISSIGPASRRSLFPAAHECMR